MRAPMKHTVKAIKEWDCMGLYDGRWYPARPTNVNGLITRIRLAWGVFVGRYDALEWERTE